MTYSDELHVRYTSDILPCTFANDRYLIELLEPFLFKLSLAYICSLYVYVGDLGGTEF